MNNQEVTLKLVRVKCVDETNGQNVERVGNDEIWLSGFSVDATATASQLHPFEVYPHFDDGEIKEFTPPKTIFTMKVPGGGSFPKKCLATLILAEKDSGDLTELTQSAFDKAIEDMKKAKDEMEAGVHGEPLTDTPTPIPTPTLSDGIEDIIIETVKDIAYKYIKGRIAAGLNDDVFPPQLVLIDVTSDDFRWGDGTKLSPETTIEFRGHGGVYYLVYYWEINTVESASERNAIFINPTVGGTVIR